jgi:NAD(P)H-dependent FMN reductase
MLLVSGSLRDRSTNTAALRTLGSLSGEDLGGELYGGLAFLPPFNPDHEGDHLPAAVVDLRTRVHAVDVVVFSTPEYAGALPGSLKNLLDWTIGDEGAASIYQKPVAWLNVSPRGAAGAHAELRTVLGYAHAVILEDACSFVPVTQAMLDPAGYVADPGARRGILTMGTQVVEGLRRLQA